VLSEYTDATENSLPPDVVQAMRHGGGGLQLYDSFVEMQQPTVHATTSNPLELFLSTLLPWNPVPNAPPLDGNQRNNFMQGLADFLANYLPEGEEPEHQGGNEQQDH